MPVGEDSLVAEDG